MRAIHAVPPPLIRDITIPFRAPKIAGEKLFFFSHCLHTDRQIEQKSAPSSIMSEHQSKKQNKTNPKTPQPNKNTHKTKTTPKIKKNNFFAQADFFKSFIRSTNVTDR